MNQLKVSNVEKAIQEFNEWKGNARIYYDKEENSLFTTVYANDVVANGTFSANENHVCIFKKRETSTVKIGVERKKLLFEIIEYVNKGWEMHQIEYELAEKFYSLGLVN